MKKKVFELLIAILFVAGFIYMNHLIKENSPNAQDAKLQELRLISKETVLYPDFVRTGQNESSRGMDAGIYQYYLSTARFENVRKFYVSELTQNGWIQIEDKDGKLTFRKNEIYIFIEHGENNTWNYALNYIWRNSQ